MAYIPVTNQSVSGMVNVGSILTTPNVLANQAGAWTASVVGNVGLTGTPSISGAVTVVGTPAVSVQGAVFISSSVAAVGTFFPTNQSVSGTVGASVIGNVNTTVTSIATVGGFVNVNLVGGSILTSSTPNQSVSGTVGASIIGAPPVTQGGAWFISGSVATVGASNPANQSVSGTVGASVIGNVNVTVTSVATVGGFLNTNIVGGSILTTSTPNQSVSGTVNACILGTANINVSNTNLNVSGSVVAFQGAGWSGSVAAVVTNTNVNVSGSVAAWLTGNASVITVPISSTIAVIQGSVAATIINTNVNVSGSVAAFQAGTHTPSAIGYIYRNDAVASTLGANQTYHPVMGDSAGRLVIKPFAAEDSATFSYSGSVVSTSVTLIKASAVGLRNYITDFWLSNTGSVTTLVTFKDGSTSILGFGIAPATGGESSPGLAVPIKTNPSQDLVFVPGSASSVLYLTINGYQAP